MDELSKKADAYLGAFRAERTALSKALMQSLRDNMPWGLKVDLGNGMRAELVPMNGVPDGSQPKQKAIYPPGDHSPVVGEGPDPIGYEDWSITFDWRLTNCDQDHIEVTAKITGGGGAV